MKHLGPDTIENYTITHHTKRFYSSMVEVMLLLPRSSDKRILVGVNRLPFLAFMHIPYSITTYEFFEWDLPIKYEYTNGKCIITDEEKIKSYLISFSIMVLDILKSGGTQNLYISENDQRNLDIAVTHKNNKDSESSPTFVSTFITLSKIQNMNNEYEICANDKVIFKSKNKLSINVVWEVLQKVLSVFISNLKRRLH